MTISYKRRKKNIERVKRAAGHGPGDSMLGKVWNEVGKLLDSFKKGERNEQS